MPDASHTRAAHAYRPSGSLNEPLVENEGTVYDTSGGAPEEGMAPRPNEYLMGSSSADHCEQLSTRLLLSAMPSGAYLRHAPPLRVCVCICMYKHSNSYARQKHIYIDGCTHIYAPWSSSQIPRKGRSAANAIRRSTRETYGVRGSHRKHLHTHSRLHAYRQSRRAPPSAHKHTVIVRRRLVIYIRGNVPARYAPCTCR